MITAANYAAFITTVDTTVGAIYSEMDVAETHNQWATTVPVGTGTVYSRGWTGMMPKPRDWYGSRVVHEPAMQIYSVETILHELTYGIEQLTQQDSAANTTSIFWRELPDMARQWRRFPEYQFRDLFEASGSLGSASRQASLDGLPHWFTAHPIDIYNPGFNGGGNALFSSGTYCNDFTGGGVNIDGTVIGGALGTTSLSSLYEYMKMIPGEDGEVLGLMPNKLMIPTSLEIEARFVLQSSFLGSPTWGAFSPITGMVGTSDNKLRELGIEITINPFLRNTKNWYLLDCHYAKHLPFIWAVREAPSVTPRINPDDPIVWDTHRLLWGGRDRSCPAWNFPWLAARSGP